MAGPCFVTPLKGLAEVLGLKEGKQISYAEWVDAFRKGVEKGDIKLDKNGNIEFGEKAETTIRQTKLLRDLQSHLGLDKESDVYTIDNVDEIDKTGFNKLQVKVLEDVKRVMGAVNNLVKNITGKELSVNVHRSEERYKKALMDLGESEEAAMSKGVYISEDGVIHLNMNRVSSETFLHEAFHPVLDYLAANNPKLIDSLYKQLRGIEGGQDFTKKSAKSYKGGGALTIKKEAITDFIAHVADGTFELTKTNYEKVKAFIQDLLRKMGIKIPEKYSDIRDIEDLKDLAEFVSQSFKTGKEIESVELDKAGEKDELGKKGQRQYSKTEEIPMSALNVLYDDSEKLPKPIKKTDNATVAKQIQEVAAEHWGGNIITSSNITAEQEASITKNGVNEAIKAYKASGKNAADWYSTAIDTAIAVAGVVHPELNSKEIASKVEAFGKEKDPVSAAQMTLRMALAITSQNLNVDANTKYAEEQFEHFKKNGKFDPSKEYGAKAPAISGNLELANLLIDTLGLNKAEEFISKEFTVRELEDAFQVATGKKLKIEGLRDDIVNGAAIFGPKIGQGFLQNLMGKFDPVTIDLWMRRTWGRWTGDVVGEGVTKDRMYTLYSTVKDAIKNKELKIDLPKEFSEYKPVEEKNKSGKSFWTMDSKFGDRIDTDFEFKDKIHKVAKEIALKANSLYKIIHDIPMSKEMYDKFISGEVSYVKTAERLKANRDKLGEKYSEYAAKERAKKNKPVSKNEWIKEQDKKEGRIYSPTNEQISEKKPKWGNAAKNIVDELNPIDIPSAMDRRVITRVVNNIRKGMAEKGYNVTNADVQALLWYPEKDIWAKLRGEEESNLKLSYDDQFIKLAKERGLGEQAEKVADEIRSGRAKSDSATFKQTADEGVSSAANEKREGGGKKLGGEKKETQYSKVENDKVADTYYEPHMTESEDGKDYVFFHVSNADPKSLEKGIDSRRFVTLSTSREEKATQYGVASFYTKPEDTESMVRGNKYVVRVPKDKVYPMDADPNGYREAAEEMIPKNAPFRSANIKKKMAEMAVKDGYQMAVGEWRFDRKGQTIPENEFRADALVPLKPTKESPQSYASNISKGMERIPHPNQENYLRADKLNDLAERVKTYYSSKSKYGEAYQIASSIVNYGGIMENLNQPNERVRPVTKEDFEIMTKDLPPELKSTANTLQFSKGEEETNDMMKDWVVSQFKAGIGESDLIEVLKQHGLSDKKAKDMVAAAVESLNEPTKAQKNKKRADTVNPFINYTPDETGVQNMVATLERIQQGKEPIEISAGDKRDWKETMRRANEFFLNPNNNIDDLVYRLKNGAAPTAEDVAVMSMHKVDLDRQMAEALERRARLVAEGNPEFLKEDAKIADISSRLEDYYEAARRSAYEQGLAFNIRKMMLANDYSIGTVLRRIKATGDEVIPTKVMEQIETLTSQLKQNTERILELEDQLQKEKAQATLDAIKETQATKKEEKPKPPAKTRVEKAVNAIQAIRAKIKAGSYFGGEKPTPKKGDFQYSKEEVDDAATAIEKGLAVIEKALKVSSASRAIEKGVRAINKAMKGAEWNEEQFRKDMSEEFTNQGIDLDEVEISDLELKDGKLNITRGYLESLVENGYDTIDQMVDYIKETEAGEKFTEREIMDAISGYGEVEYPPADEISQKISIAKGEGKSLSALADVVKGMLPKRSGFQRREKTDRERTLLKEIRQRLKAFPEDAEKSAKSWASALDRIKSAYRNRITDLDNAIKENKKIFKEKRETKLDDEARSLKEQKEALQSVYDKMFAPEIKSNIEKLVGRVNEYTKKINEAKKNNDPEAERKAQIEKDLTEGVINDLKAAARANRTEQEKKLDELKNRLRKQIEQLNKKIDGTYEKKAKIEFTLDDETVGLTQEVEQLKGLLEGMTGVKTESDAEKAERLVNYYEKQVAQLEADIEAMNIGYRVKSTFAPTPEMQKVKNKLEDLREMRQMLREQLGLAYERDVKLAEKRNERAIKQLEQKKQAIINGTYKPKLKKPTPTSNLIEIQKKTKAAISNQIEQIIADRERANRSKFQKIVDSVSEVFRASVLSGIATLEKLMGYGIMESHIAQPLGGLVVGQITRAIPYINRINKMAGGRMTLSPAAEAKKVAKGVATFWSKETWADTKQVAKTGKSELDLLWGEFKVTHPEIGAWVGHLHKALKNPTVRASFVRHMEGNLIYFSKTMKMSVSDPAVVEMASRTSLLDAYSDILLNKNYFSSQWNALVRNAELMGKGKNVYLQNTGIVLSGFLKVLEPVTGVPVNAANRLISYYPPIGAARAMLGILSNAVKGIKPEEMTREDAAEIIRNIKSAGVGAIGYAIGYIFAALFGGSDDDEKFRNEMGLKKGEFAFMPKAMGHHALWEIMQIGATDRRMDDKGEGDAANKFNNYKKLQWEYVENTPFFDLPLTVEEAMTEKGGASRIVGGLVRNATTPMFVQQLSKFMDTDAEGNPINRSRDGFLDELASGIYPLRASLPVKGGYALKEKDQKYFEDINFIPKMAKKTDDKFTLKGKEVITEEEYNRYTKNVNNEFNAFLSENLDALRYRGYSQEEEDEINEDLVSPMTPAEISDNLESKKKDMLSRAKAAIERKQTLEYQYNKNMITTEVYDREIRSAETELKNISNWINGVTSQE